MDLLSRNICSCQDIKGYREYYDRTITIDLKFLLSMKTRFINHCEKWNIGGSNLKNSDIHFVSLEDVRSAIEGKLITN